MVQLFPFILLFYRLFNIYFISSETTKRFHLPRQIRRDAYFLSDTIFSTTFFPPPSTLLPVSRISSQSRFPPAYPAYSVSRLPVPCPPWPKLHLASLDKRKRELWKSAAKRICNGKRSRDLRLGSPYRLSPFLLFSPFFLFHFYSLSSLPGFHRCLRLPRFCFLSKRTTFWIRSRETSGCL